MQLKDPREANGHVLPDNKAPGRTADSERDVGQPYASETEDYAAAKAKAPEAQSRQAPQRDRNSARR